MFTRLAVIVALALSAHASAEAASLIERAQPLFPQAKIDAVEPTPIPGVYEVRSGKTILYMDEGGRYVLLGELYDFQGRKNLTAERILAMRATRFDELPLQHAIRLGPEHGARRLAMFDDVDCPFCRRFHEETLPALLRDGVTVYVFLFPLERLHPQAKAKSEAVWCSADRAQALEAAMLGQPVPSAGGQCTSPLPAIKALATRLGITGTPTLILDTGSRIDGFVSRQTLEARWKRPQRPER